MFDQYGFDHIVIETPEEKERKRRTLKNLFSRLFIALFVYTSLATLLSTAVYVFAPFFIGEESFVAILDSSTASVIIGSIIQYLICFPIFLAIACHGTKSTERKEGKKLSIKDFFLLFCITQLALYVGNTIGTTLNAVIGNTIGKVPENSVQTIVNEVPIYIIFIFAVVIGPIVEEIIFRRVLIDRMSVFGEHIAIIFSSVAFGLMHQNLYQFFYATMIGLILGYVYTVTGNVKYTILLHILINFIGSIAVIPVSDAVTVFSELLAAAELGQSIALLDLMVSGTIVLVYSTVEAGLVIGGIIAMTDGIRKKKIRIPKNKEIFLPDREIYSNGISNVGALMFIGLSCVFTIINLFV